MNQPEPIEATPSAINELRKLAGFFDAAVTSARLQPDALSPGAQRVVEIWRRNPTTQMALKPGKILVDDKLIFESKKKAGRWLLPATMAGLHSIRLRPEGSIDDVMRLALELAQLKADTAYIRSFHDWLFSDGAEGFDIELGVSFVEAADALGFRDGIVGSSVVRGIAAVAVGGIAVLSTEIDAAATRPELGIAVDTFFCGAETGAFDADEAAIERLRQKAESRTSWSLVELDALVHCPVLRAGVPPNAFAARVIERFMPPLRPDLLDVLRRILADKDPYFEDTRERLEELGLGRRLALGLTFHPVEVGDEKSKQTLSEVSWLVESLGDRGSKELVEGLFERAVKERPVRANLATFLARDTSSSLGKMNITMLGRDSASGLLLSASESSLPPDTIAEIVTNLPLHSLIEGLTLGGPSIRRRVRATTQKVLETATDDERRQLVTLTLEEAESEDLLMLLESITSTNGVGWLRIHAGQLARAAIESGLGDKVVELARTRRCDNKVRSAFIDEIKTNKDLVSDLLKFRMSSYVDPQPVAERIQTLRARRKTAQAKQL